MIQLSILIVNYNTETFIEGLLVDLKEQSINSQAFEIVIVNNVQNTQLNEVIGKNEVPRSRRCLRKHQGIAVQEHDLGIRHQALPSEIHHAGIVVHAGDREVDSLPPTTLDQPDERIGRPMALRQASAQWSGS